MNLLLNQMGREVRGYRGYLLLWLGVLVLHAFCVSSGEHWATHELKRHPLIVLFRMSGLAVFLGALFLSKASALRDPPLDPDAYWRAKPAGGAVVLWAKVLGLMLVFVVPVFCIEGWIAARYGGMGMLGAVAADQFLVRGSALVAMLALAALAGGSMRLVVLVLGGLLVLGLGTGALSWTGLPRQFDFTPTVIASRLLVAGLCAWIGSLLVLGWLYGRGSGRAAFAVAGITALTIQTVFLAWPVDLYRHSPTVATDITDLVTIEVAQSEWLKPGIVLSSTLRQGGAPLPARLHKVRVSLASPAGETERVCVRAFLREPERAEWADAIALAGSEEALPDLGYWSNLDISDGPLFVGPATLTLAAELDLYGFERVGELPLEAGSSLRVEHGELEVLGLSWAPGVCQVLLREKVLQPIFALRGPIAVLPQDGPGLLWSLILPPGGDQEVPRLVGARQNRRQVPPGTNEESLFGMFRYQRTQLQIPRLPDEPDSIDLIERYRGRTLEVYQRVYRGTLRRTVVRDDVALPIPEEGS